MRIFNDEDQQEIIRLYSKEKMTLKFIRTKFACREEAIKNVLIKNNIPIIKRRSKNKFLNEDYFSSIDTEEKAYILGLLFTDGNISLDNKRQPNIRLSLKLSDVDILLKIKEELNLDCSLIYDKRENKECATLSFRSKKIADDLNNYNIIPNKTYLIKHLPKINEKFLSHFLRGLVDGDGSIYWNKKIKSWCIDFTNYNKEICEDFHNIINKLINKTNALSIKNYGSSFHVRWQSKKDSKKIMEVLYKNNNISIARKNRLANAILEDKSGEDIV